MHPFQITMFLCVYTSENASVTCKRLEENPTDSLTIRGLHPLHLSGNFKLIHREISSDNVSGIHCKILGYSFYIFLVMVSICKCYFLCISRTLDQTSKE